MDAAAQPRGVAVRVGLVVHNGGVADLMQALEHTDPAAVCPRPVAADRAVGQVNRSLAGIVVTDHQPAAVKRRLVVVERRSQDFRGGTVDADTAAAVRLVAFECGPQDVDRLGGMIPAGCRKKSVMSDSGIAPIPCQWTKPNSTKPQVSLKSQQDD